MIDLKEIHSLSDFQRKTKLYIEHLKTSGKPQVLTIKGNPEIVLQDAKSYQMMLDYIDNLESLVGRERGLKEMQQGKTKLLKKDVELVKGIIREFRK